MHYFIYVYSKHVLWVHDIAASSETFYFISVDIAIYCFACSHTDKAIRHADRLSRVMRKPDFCICENKGADQLCCNRAADQRIWLRYINSTILLLCTSVISSLLLSSVVAQPDLCRTWSETIETGYLLTQLRLREAMRRPLF